MSNTISVQEKFGQEITSIWDKPEYADVPFRQYGFAVQDSMITEGLLFIGLNPRQEN